MSSADIKIKKITMQLGDKVLLIQFDMFAFEQLETLYGTMEDALKALEKGSMKTLLDIVWAGAVGLDETLNRKELGKNVTFAELIGQQELLMDCIMAGMPQAQEQTTMVVANESPEQPKAVKK